jgi:hypothetical protein
VLLDAGGDEGMQDLQEQSRPPPSATTGSMLIIQVIDPRRNGSASGAT